MNVHARCGHVRELHRVAPVVLVDGLAEVGAIYEEAPRLAIAVQLPRCGWVHRPVLAVSLRASSTLLVDFSVLHDALPTSHLRDQSNLRAGFALRFVPPLARQPVPGCNGQRVGLRHSCSVSDTLGKTEWNLEHVIVAPEPNFIVTGSRPGRLLKRALAAPAMGSR